ncbi:hypothetical protein CCUS01_14577 [Colletotrichum cuscutae]|uniref:Uncharacterized protein n=1 Tax=Colletotrichum cuscutae TaxID=1209917 RepID=A0AAI9Y8R8_9PEZI|nr:hypothetical protein CCUS01_14577 [Colletotrichum cuscutae]
MRGAALVSSAGSQGLQRSLASLAANESTKPASCHPEFSLPARWFRWYGELGRLRSPSRSRTGSLSSAGLSVCPYQSPKVRKSCSNVDARNPPQTPVKVKTNEQGYSMTNADPGPFGSGRVSSRQLCSETGRPYEYLQSFVRKAAGGQLYIAFPEFDGGGSKTPGQTTDAPWLSHVGTHAAVANLASIRTAVGVEI